MKKEDFHIGLEFYTGSGKWRCTDVGTRVIVAIRVDRVRVCTYDTKTGASTAETVTNDPSWFNGPPYAVAEFVLDELDMGGCCLDPEQLPEMHIEES